MSPQNTTDAPQRVELLFDSGHARYSILSFISGAGYIGQRAIPVILTAILAKTAFVIYVCTVGKHIFINNVHL